MDNPPIGEAGIRMQLSPEDCRLIFMKSQSLAERQKAGGWHGLRADGASLDAQRRIKEWCELVAEGDERQFANRLAFDGLDHAAALELLDDSADHGSVDTPTWTDLLNDFLEEIGRYSDENECSFINAKTPQPFEDLFVPIILLARRSLKKTVGSAGEILSAQAASELERLLLIRLTEVSGRVLEVEFNTYLACLQFSGLPHGELNPESSEHYRGFIRHLKGGGIKNIFLEYPVLARRITLRFSQWLALADEFLQRLGDDLSEVQQRFNQPELGKIRALEPGLSDSHCSGRAVISITFQSGFKLVYKPKLMGLEAGYFAFAGYLNQLGLPLNFKEITVINRGDYGWVEHVAPADIIDDKQAENYFRRSGMLLCLIYLFEGVDFHSENLIAHGEYPVPIDMETFFHHRLIQPHEISELISAANLRISDSVLRTHFLPQLYQIRDKFMDITGMGSMPGDDVGIEIPRWRHINSDAMNYRLEKLALTPNGHANAPRMAGRPLEPDAFTEEIVAGFQEMYRILKENRTKLTAPGGPLEALFQNKSRFVFRSTSLYEALIKQTAHPSYQRDGADVSIQYEILCRPFASLSKKPKFWPLVAREMEEMWALDIPKFAAFGNSDSLDFPNHPRIDGIFSTSPYQFVSSTLQGLCEDNLATQVEFIKGSMIARKSRSSIHLAGDHEPTDEHEMPVLLDRTALIEHALRVGEELRNHAFFSKSGEPSWILLKGIPHSDQVMLTDNSFPIYDGSTGIALFFAALEKLVPDAGFGELARASVAMLIRWLGQARRSEIQALGLGGFTGLGSIVYSLTRMAGLLDDSPLLAAAELAAAHLNSVLIDSDNSLDLLSGAAGAIPALIVLHHANSRSDALMHAEQCAAHLLNQRVLSAGGFRTWNSSDQRLPLTGFSHGSAGIASALLRLYEVVGDVGLRAAAEEAIAYESSTFDRAAGNWPDFRYSNDVAGMSARCMTAWCHGAPGIALGRLAGLGGLDSPSIREDIRVALQTTRKHTLQAHDHICCGNSGRAEIMLTAGLRLSDESLQLEALRLTSQVVARARRGPKFSPVFLHELYNPTFFQGNAGLGYHLLRLAEPSLPSVIMLE